jgi:hypothetical protein
MVLYLTKEQRARVRAMLDADQPLREIARQVGCSMDTCRRA